ncbi:MAG: carboxypeptidase-like regulatory domain-containing protein [Ginsengibacter sp.]
MKKSVFTFLLFAFVFVLSGITASVQAQSSYFFVKGKITDATTKAPLPGASVFAENTTIGAVTNEEGDFKIWLPDGGYSLVVTFTGFETEIKRVSRSIAQEGNVNFELNEKVKALEEVNIVITNEVKNGWEKYGAFFTDNFIGKSIFGKQCVIKNPEDLRFFFNKRRNSLKVLSKEPLIVDNFALGYVIKFAIDSFVNHYNTNANLFTGQPLFEEMEGTDEQKRMWKANREKAFNGSKLHFMRSLYDRALAENGFEVQFIVKKDGEETPIRLGNVYGALNYRKDDSLQTVHFRPNQQDVALIYNRDKPEKNYLDSDSSIKAKTFQLSTLTFEKDAWIVIEKNGFFYDQEDITTNGYLAFKKVGDMLPYNYGIKEVAMPIEEELPSYKPEDSVSVSGHENISIKKEKIAGEDEMVEMKEQKNIIINEGSKPVTIDDIKKLMEGIERKNYSAKQLAELQELLMKFIKKYEEQS